MLNLVEDIQEYIRWNRSNHGLPVANLEDDLQGVFIYYVNPNDPDNGTDRGFVVFINSQEAMDWINSGVGDQDHRQWDLIVIQGNIVVPRDKQVVTNITL